MDEMVGFGVWFFSKKIEGPSQRDFSSRDKKGKTNLEKK